MLDISLGLLIIRLALGLTLAGHGSQKLFGWFGGFGLKSTASWMHAIGLRPALLIALVAGSFELASGMLFSLGIWLPFAAVLAVLVMLGAIVAVHVRHGYWIAHNGMEYNVVLMAAAVGLALVGAGDYALGS